jgi:hypothetical protein
VPPVAIEDGDERLEAGGLERLVEQPVQLLAVHDPSQAPGKALLERPELASENASTPASMPLPIPFSMPFSIKRSKKMFSSPMFVISAMSPASTSRLGMRLWAKAPRTARSTPFASEETSASEAPRILCLDCIRSFSASPRIRATYGQMPGSSCARIGPGSTSQSLTTRYLHARRKPNSPKMEKVPRSPWYDLRSR